MKITDKQVSSQWGINHSLFTSFFLFFFSLILPRGRKQPQQNRNPRRLYGLIIYLKQNISRMICILKKKDLQGG